MFEGKGVIVHEIGVAGSNPALNKIFILFAFSSFLAVFGLNPWLYTRNRMHTKHPNRQLHPEQQKGLLFIRGVQVALVASLPPICRRSWIQ